MLQLGVGSACRWEAEEGSPALLVVTRRIVPKVDSFLPLVHGRLTSASETLLEG